MKKYNKYYFQMLSHTEVVDPICLSINVKDACDKCCCCGEMDINCIPANICRVFDDSFVDTDSGKRVYVTIGLFSIVRLERDVQLLIPVIDYCIPQNECVTSTDNNPCDLFDKIGFPVDEFFPPEKSAFDNCEPDINDCNC